MAEGSRREATFSPNSCQGHPRSAGCKEIHEHIGSTLDISHRIQLISHPFNLDSTADAVPDTVFLTATL